VRGRQKVWGHAKRQIKCMSPAVRCCEEKALPYSLKNGKEMGNKKVVRGVEGRSSHIPYSHAIGTGRVVWQAAVVEGGPAFTAKAENAAGV